MTSGPHELPPQSAVHRTSVSHDAARIESLCADVARRVRPMFGEMSEDEVLQIARRSVHAALQATEGTP